MRQLIEGNPPSRHATKKGVSLSIVSSDVNNHFHLACHQSAILPGPQFQVNPGWIFAVIMHILFPGQAELYRSPGLEGKSDTHRGCRVHLNP
jgi:hypothetical protein